MPFAQIGDFSLGDDLGTLFGQPGEDVFMVKLSYWIGQAGRRADPRRGRPYRHMRQRFG